MSKLATSHTGYYVETRPHACPKCKNRYVDENNLARHILNNHLREVLTEGFKAIVGYEIRPIHHLLNLIIYPKSRQTFKQQANHRYNQKKSKTQLALMQRLYDNYMHNRRQRQRLYYLDHKETWRIKYNPKSRRQPS